MKKLNKFININKPSLKTFKKNLKKILKKNMIQKLKQTVHVEYL